ncbi:MAG: hypothetical protein PWR04_1121 [Anaerophaga sp.]|nr:hypothetical protein [Anaerophaga sp.]
MLQQIYDKVFENIKSTNCQNLTRTGQYQQVIKNQITISLIS